MRHVRQRVKMVSDVWLCCRKGTNTELDFAAGAEGEDRLLAAKNKWLIAHEEAGIVGAFCGLKGENVTV